MFFENVIKKNKILVEHYFTYISSDIMTNILYSEYFTYVFSSIASNFVFRNF